VYEKEGNSVLLWVAGRETDLSTFL